MARKSSSTEGRLARGAAQEEALDPIAQEKARAEERHEREQYRSAVKELSFRAFLGDLVSANARPMPAVPRPPQPPRPRNRVPTERHALLCWNDWHFEENVRAEGVHGLNSYDISTACRRVWRVVQAAILWKRDREAGGKQVVPHLTVALLGDMLTGTLHGLERHSSAPNIVRAALACGDLLALALQKLAEEWPEIRVVGVVGNHGRLPDDRKVPTKDPTRSWDYLAYEIARRRLERQKNISFFFPEAYGVLFDVAGHQCYGAHGNFLPNSLGIVGYGVRRFTSALAGNLSAAGKPLKYAYFGHWHSSSSAEFAGVEAFICPALVGAQEYSFLSGGSVNRPAQDLHVFDRDLGRVALERLYGEGPGEAGTFDLVV